LPYYIDGDVKLTQSVAILRYIARKYHLNGSTEQDRIRIDLAECQIKDLMTSFYANAIQPNYEQLKVNFLPSLKVQLEQFVEFLGSGDYVTGNSLSYVDFWLYEYLVKIKVFAEEVFGEFKSLVEFVDRIEALPQIQKYNKSQGALIFSGPKYAWNAKY